MIIIQLDKMECNYYNYIYQLYYPLYTLLYIFLYKFVIYGRVNRPTISINYIIFSYIFIFTHLNFYKDIMAIMNVYVAKINGLRKYKIKKI
jgi:hypothetical protein